MTDEKFAQLKRSCAAYLTVNGIKPATKAGRTATHTFWRGALCAMEDNEARTVIFLMSGRYESLVDFTPEPTPEQVRQKARDDAFERTSMLNARNEE